MATVAVRTNDRAPTFPYDELIQREGLPVVIEKVGVADLLALPRAPWERLGGSGTFIQLVGAFESERGLYVAEIPPGGALNPERHLYEKEIFVLQGRGAAEVWQGSRAKQTFEWGEGSVFAIPRNVWHRFYNVSPTPVVFLAVTTAPRVMNALENYDALFNTDYDFVDLYGEGDSYFAASDTRTVEGWYNQTIWHTNFIPDARNAGLNALEQKVAGGELTGYRMGRRFPHGHISQWPSGRYHKAHYHGPGAILLGLDGEGYVLAWPHAAGPRPYQDGFGEQVVKVHWGKNSIYCPPDSWFHQHFNTGPGPARHVAVYGAKLTMGVGATMDDGRGGYKGHLSMDEGGTLIEYEDEDPQIRRDFEAEIGSKGIRCEMPAFAYR